MGFRDAVAATAELKDAYRSGLQAIRTRDRDRIHCGSPRRLSGSVDLDTALRDSHPSDPRWDYGIGLRIGGKAERVSWVEIHPASSEHVQEVLEKLAWLRAWLRASAPRLNEMAQEYVWVASGRVRLPPNAPKRRRLAAQGLRFAGERLML